VRGKWKFIPATVVTVLVVASLIAQVSGIERKILHVVFRSQETGPASVVQDVLDRDGDGQPDSLQIRVREFQPGQCVYLWRDPDRDGLPDKLEFLVAKRLACRLLDDDKDGVFEVQGVGIYSIYDKDSRYLYQDLDLDGRFDAMLELSRGTRVDAYLFMQETLVRPLQIKTDDWRQAWIIGANGTKVKVIFEDGEWRVVR